MSLAQTFPFLNIKIEPVYDSDAIDRLRYFTTSIFLILCSVFIMAKQYVGESIQCWVPVQFSGKWESYAETFCLIENTYFVNMNDSNLPSSEQRERSEMRYYQWVPFILLLMALTLYLPRVLWNSLIGLNITSVTAQLRSDARDRLAPNTYPISKSFFQYNFTISLLLTKIAATVVIFASLVFMDYFLNIGPFCGWTVTMDLINGRQWQQSGTFPRVTYCDFQVREIGYVNNWSVQCVLMVNMFNEKLFILLWWWYTILATLSIYDITRFVFRFSARSQISFIREILNIGADLEVHETEVSEFNRAVLKHNGIHFMHLVYANSSIFVAAHFLRPHYLHFQRNSSKIR